MSESEGENESEHLRAQSAAPAPKSALLGSQSTAPATKSALRGSPISAVPATTPARRGSPNAAPATKSALQSSQVLLLPRNLHIEGHRVRLPRNLQTSHMSKSHDSLHLSRNQSGSKITTMSKVLHLPRWPPDSASLRSRNAHRRCREA